MRPATDMWPQGLKDRMANKKTGSNELDIRLMFLYYCIKDTDCNSNK